MRLEKRQVLVLASLVWMATACGEDPEQVWTPPPTTGGSTGTGGASTGGSTGTGGASTGGSATGGAATGGESMSGGSSSGGTDTGGAQNAAGGDPSSGGAGAGGDGAGGDGSGGAGAGGTAGSAWCEEYCDAWFQKACNDAGGEAYSGQPACMTACASMAEGTPGASSGDTVACRITHLGLAAQMDPAHCGHAQENSTGNCLD